MPFASGPFPAPAVGEELWALGKAGPPRKGGVSRWIPNPHDGNLCVAPSTVFVLSVRPKPSSPAVVSPLVAPEARAKSFAFGADVDGDGAVDVAEASEPGGCQGSPTARRLAFDPAYDGCDGEYCLQLWAHMATTHRQSGMSYWYDGMAADEASTVHQFAIGEAPDATRYTGRGVVAGHVLNQFSMTDDTQPLSDTGALATSSRGTAKHLAD